MSQFQQPCLPSSTIPVSIEKLTQRKREPTHPDGSPRGNRWISSLKGGNITRQSSRRTLWHILTKPLTQVPLLFFSIRGVPNSGLVSGYSLEWGSTIPFSRARAAVEPVRHEDLVFLVAIAGCQDISPLNSLIKVAENVENSNNSFRSFVWAGHICIALC